MKKFIRRIGTVVLSAALCAGALAMFAGCTTKHPEVTITYSFRGVDYDVDYVLSRNDAPQTVTHFLELAEAGFYNGVCVHDYSSNFLYTGGFRLEDENGQPYVYDPAETGSKTYELKEIDYKTEVQKLETADRKFTQSVWKAAGTANNPAMGEPCYTVYGEFADNGVSTEYARENSHTTGALVMYYHDKEELNIREEVTVRRADGGKNNDGQEYAKEYQISNYKYNCATSMFYTYTSPSANSTLERKYCVFGMAKDYSGQLENGLLKAISTYISEQSSEDSETAFSFTTEQLEFPVDRYDIFESVSKAGNTATFQTPLEMPIIIKSVRINKY